MQGEWNRGRAYHRVEIDAMRVIGSLVAEAAPALTPNVGAPRLDLDASS